MRKGMCCYGFEKHKLDLVAKIRWREVSLYRSVPSIRERAIID